MNPVAIVYNTRAGKGRSKKLVDRVSTVLRKRSVLFESFEDEWPKDYSGYSSVWIFGGDGTLNYFINHAIQPLPPLAIFKGGTGNDFATLLYNEASADEMVDIILNAKPRPVDAGVCNSQLFLNMAGLGFDGQALKNMQTIRWMGSFVGYYYAIIKTIFSYKEPYYLISVDGGSPVTDPLLLVQIANSSTTGGGFKVSPLADIADGKFNLMRCDPLGVYKRLIKLPLVRKGKHLELSFVTHDFVEHVKIETQAPIPAQLDGELIYADHFEFSILPGYFRFLY
ncbi:MAG TPA: diacylglycerol kinase family protein [Chitinophagaceae bacterium]|nr:diacylglycerol kinase family protein [Chitinophagaceae bacterium]